MVNEDGSFKWLLAPTELISPLPWHHLISYCMATYSSAAGTVASALAHTDSLEAIKRREAVR